MKKLFVILLVPVLLLGCAAEPVFEQVEDVYSGTDPVPGILQVVVPEQAAVLADASEGSGQLYFCEAYTLTVQTLAGGDMDRTLRTLTGYPRDALTVLETKRDGIPCFSCAWTSIGEAGDQVGRLVLLDDGVYHYAVTVMADAEKAGELAREWERVLSGVTLAETGP